MVATRNQDSSSGTVDPIAAQLEAIVAKLDAMESLKEDVAALKRRPHFHDRHGGGNHDEGESSWRSQSGNRPFNKIEFPNYGGGDPRGWILKAEKYFKYYHIPEDEKVDIASMHLDGDALDLFSWLSTDHRMMFWEDLTHAFQKNFGPAEFQNPDEFLCSIRQTGTVQEYRQEFAKRSARVADWPDHCLLGVFLNGLKEELKADVRIHKPHTVFNAVSLALQFETKVSHIKSQKTSSGTPTNTSIPDPKKGVTNVYSGTGPAKTGPRLSETEKQARYLKGECFRCGDKYGPGHRCKAGTFKLQQWKVYTRRHKEAGRKAAADWRHLDLTYWTGVHGSLSG
ncbi:hypothetical protein E3N88_31006 [Mikania micrantha]|uniref:Retrotransposon gag domain-containing protein n=1 Tax=Mikania micrantha TaxID=192012 RepID=A0A5N6MP17_9ASTR|nr:hypothetical protein E3N88_31006 [Mikania micrantha]